MEKPSFFERANNWVKNSVMLKLLTIGILILFLLIPVDMVQDVIREREYRKQDAVAEVSGKWGNEQTVAGLVLTIPYTEYFKQVSTTAKEGYVMIANRRYAHFFPDQLDITGEVTPEVRYRGIYKAVVYKAKLNVAGKFPQPDFEQWKIENSNVLWDEAFVSLGLSDLRGIQQSVVVKWNGTDYAFEPGVEVKDVIVSGISTQIPVDSANKEYTFALDLDFNGSSGLDFIPFGKTTTVKLTSPWNDPKFEGAFLPDERDISETGFSATWDVLHLNRSFPQSFRGATTGLMESSFGVDLIVPVDEYQKSMRSAKYAAMFITLTFLIIFFVQIMNKVRVHPIQYIIVGLALCVFYTLLIGLSEHIPFSLSYLVASTAIIGMITLYTHSIFKIKRITMLVALLLSALYLFIYTIVQMEAFALLMGSIGLFVVLAVVMYLTRKIDWYNIQK